MDVVNKSTVLMKKFLLLFTILLSVSCVDGNTDIWSDTVLAIPDFEATNEEQYMKDVFENIVMTKVEVKDNKFVLLADREDFTSVGLQEIYYDKMLLALKIQNRTLRKMNRKLRQMAEEGLIPNEEADVIFQFEKAQKEYLQRHERF